jgi:putative MFS transporter
MFFGATRLAGTCVSLAEENIGEIPMPRRARQGSALLVVALGYFVDAYDIVVFSTVRVPSLLGLGTAQRDITAVGLHLLNVQLAGMLLGGFLWGTLGDKGGRRSTLLASIFLYSLATFANGFVTSVPAYAALRFAAGVGLAGELGAGVTLLSETLSQKWRGLGNTFVGISGILGGVAAATCADRLPWQAAYLLGGMLGFLLLAARLRVDDPEVYKRLRMTRAPRGSLRVLLCSPGTLSRYVYCLLLSGPNWVGLGLFIGLAPELCRANVTLGHVTVGQATMAFLLGMAVGESVAGLTVTKIGLRRQTIGLFLVLWAVACCAFLGLHDASRASFLLACTGLGVGAGYWPIFLTYVSELFGTNLRALATVSLPNMSRAKVIPASAFLAACMPRLGISQCLSVIAGICFAGAIFALTRLPETHGRSLDYVEGWTEEDLCLSDSS